MNRVFVEAYVSNLDLQASNLLVCNGTFLDSPPVSSEDHVPDLLHVLSSFSNVEDHVEGLVYAPNSLRLFWRPSHCSEGLGHLGFVSVLADLALFYQVQDRIFERFDFDVDLVVLVRRLSLDRARSFSHSLTIDHYGFGGNNLHPCLSNQSVSNLKVQRTHSRDQILASFLVDASYEVRIFKRELSQNLNQLGKIPVELRLYGYRDNWLGNVVDSFEGDELFHRGESFSGLHVL